MKASATAHYQPYAVLLNESKPNRCRREGVRGREDSLGGRAIPQPLSMGNRGADRRHGLAMAPAGLRASAGVCGAGD